MIAKPYVIAADPSHQGALSSKASTVSLTRVGTVATRLVLALGKCRSERVFEFGSA
jgi:hypothetical protein